MTAWRFAITPPPAGGPAGLQPPSPGYAIAGADPEPRHSAWIVPGLTSRLVSGASAVAAAGAAATEQEFRDRAGGAAPPARPEPSRPGSAAPGSHASNYGKPFSSGRDGVHEQGSDADQHRGSQEGPGPPIPPDG
jgi:hypothetical protein